MSKKTKKPLMLLNFHVLSWRLSQWVCTITFVLFTWLTGDQLFGYFNTMNVRYFTLLAFVAFVAIMYAQLYAYGAWVNKPVSIIYIPAIIIGSCFIFDLALAYILRNIGYTVYWSAYLYRYGVTLVQNLILLWVWYDVETIEIPESEIVQNVALLEEYK